jgi:hypothetical protein
MNEERQYCRNKQSMENNMNAQFKTIMDYRGYDFTIVKMGFEGQTTIDPWYCAYVSLKGLLRPEYKAETYRQGHIIGIDTNHGWNMHQSLDERLSDAIRQIKSVIDEHKDQK